MSAGVANGGRASCSRLLSARKSARTTVARLLVAVSAAILVTPVSAQQTPPDPLRYKAGAWDIKLGLDGGAQVVGQWGSWWNLAATVAPAANFNPDLSWSEVWIKPSLRMTYTANEVIALYGGLAVAGTRTFDKDVFEQGDTGRMLLENAFAGVRISGPAGATLDLSGGQQDYTIGSGMLINLGGGNGFERGALLFAPRTAWEMTAIARLKAGPFSFDGFYLDPNELKSGDSSTKLAGAKAEIEIAPKQTLGLAYINVLSSEYPSMQAPLTLIPNGRDGLNTLHGYVRWEPFSSLPGLYVAGEYAHQWNERIDQNARGGRAEIGYTAAALPLTPTFSYAFSHFSGDDPGTAKNERFDPLYYAGSPTLWATGGNASMAFYNSNVQAHRFGVDLVLSQQDFLKFRYWYVDAVELNSPIQFGQATRLGFPGGFPTLLVGVQKPHLSDDFYLEYTRILTQNLFLTSGVALSIPGEGLKDIANGSVDNWWGGFVAVTWKY